MEVTNLQEVSRDKSSPVEVVRHGQIEIAMNSKASKRWSVYSCGDKQLLLVKAGREENWVKQKLRDLLKESPSGVEVSMLFSRLREGPTQTIESDEQEPHIEILIVEDKGSYRVVEQISRGGTTFNWISTESNGPDKLGYRIRQLCEEIDVENTSWATLSTSQGVPKTHVFVSGKKDLVWSLVGGRKLAVGGLASVLSGLPVDTFELKTRDPNPMPPIYQVAKRDFSGTPVRSSVVVKAVESTLGNLAGEVLVVR